MTKTYYVAQKPEMNAQWEIRQRSERGGYYQIHATETEAEAVEIAASWNGEV